MRVAGIVLAAGAGTRMGRPKGLMRDAGGEPWVRLAVSAMKDAGCEPVVVVTGARGEEVAALVPAGVTVVQADGWAEGMGASLRSGLMALADRAESAERIELTGPTGLTGLTGLTERADPADGADRAERGDSPSAAVIGLVDMPDVTAAVVTRLLASVEGVPNLRDALARVAYHGRPGHPVLLGRDHWSGVLAVARGDVGARYYLRGREDVVLVEAGDLASGLDLDTPRG